jgi:hypothetical protein
MITLTDKINESNKEKVFVIYGSDNTIHSVWPAEDDAQKECDKINKEIGGSFFTVKSSKKTDFVKD